MHRALISVSIIQRLLCFKKHGPIQPGLIRRKNRTSPKPKNRNQPAPMYLGSRLSREGGVFVSRRARQPPSTQPTLKSHESCRVMQIEAGEGLCSRLSLACTDVSDDALPRPWLATPPPHAGVPASQLKTYLLPAPSAAPQPTNYGTLHAPSPRAARGGGRALHLFQRHEQWPDG